MIVFCPEECAVYNGSCVGMTGESRLGRHGVPVVFHRATDEQGEGFAII